MGKSAPKRKDGRPSKLCPVCGVPQLMSTLFLHVGSTRCLIRLQFDLRGLPHDRVNGPKALDLSIALAELLRKL